jgi:hypothetical protein
VCSITTPPGNCQYSFLVTVTDAKGQAATGTLSVSIALLPLKITTTSLPGGTVGVVYSTQLNATGGLPKQ